MRTADPPLHPIPADLGAEQATLGALLVDRDAIVAVADTLRPADFYLEKHAQVYAAILACYAQRIPPDLRTVSDELRRRHHLDTIGGIAMLSDLAAATPTAVHILYYAAIVTRCATRRRLITAGAQIAALGYDETQEVAAVLAHAEAALLEVVEHQTSDFVSMAELTSSYFEALHAADDEPESRLRTGFSDLDALLGHGFQRGTLVLLAARPSVGKTGFALNVARHMARAGGHVGMFSAEMTSDLLMQRWVAMETGVSSQHQRQRRMTDAQRHAITTALGRLSQLAVSVDDTSGLTVTDARAKALRLHRHRPLDLLIVDYLQLLKASVGRAANREQEVAEISRGLKDIARRLNVPVLALAQFNREADTGPPQLRHLRESGSLEQDSDIVCALWRPHREEEAHQTTGTCVVELVVLKHRNGPTGVVPLLFDKASQVFRQPAVYRAHAGA